MRVLLAVVVAALVFGQGLPFPGPGRAPASGGGGFPDPFSDTFDAGSALSSDWTGALDEPFEVSGGNATCPGVADCGALVDTTSYSNNQYAQGVLYVGSTENYRALLLLVRSGPTSGYALFVAGNATTIIDINTFGTLATCTDASGQGNGATYRLEVSGTSLTALRDGTPLTGCNGFTDSTYSSGKVGMGARNNGDLVGFQSFEGGSL